MRVLIYKRTHNGDPDDHGCFGAYDCMGAVRAREYDAVIGIGGIGPEPRGEGIAGRVNWIGIGPHKTDVEGKRGPEVTFDHFVNFGTDGPDLAALAPALAKRMYGRNVRHLLGGLRVKELTEAEGILELAKDQPPSPLLRAACSSSSARRCGHERPTKRCS